jgi:DNA repair protein SbcC/Rad50
MLDWILKKNKDSVGDRSETIASDPEGDGRPAAEVDSASTDDWDLKLQAAMGDDSALLALARLGAPVDVKVAAIGALTSEAALKLAEREHRDRDRRVHRLAKQRHIAQVALRETAEQASRLIEAARALLEEPLIPANFLVKLDRDWQALEPMLVDAGQRAEFDALLAQLVALTRERGDHSLQVERWMAEARQALARLHAACVAAATGAENRLYLADSDTAAQAVLDTAPAEATTATLRDSLRSALQSCAQLDERLALLEQLLKVPSTDKPTASPELAASGGSSEADGTRQDPAMRWCEFPPLADAQLAEALARRVEQWQQARDQAHQARRAERRERARGREREVRNERTHVLATALDRAEAALAAGHLADTHAHLVEVDKLLQGGASAASLQSRIDAVQAEYTRLKGWQHWGGGLARDELVLQVEAFAAATRGESGTDILKLSIKQQAEVIDDLRARWKELDRLGGATSRSLWQRFDAALKSAYQPVAAHLAVQRAARAQNLQARVQLVDALTAVALPDRSEGHAAPGWKALAATLERFHAEWRKLRPLEHTVPHKEREKLTARMGAAVERLEAPLNEARRVAQLQRERLIANAETLAAEAATGAHGRELASRARAMQVEWQRHATTLPLARAAESALWARFKTNIDAIFNAGEASFKARDAELKAHGVERAALVERLAAMSDQMTAFELKRTLAEVEAQWQRLGPAPRADAAALESRFLSARNSARSLLATGAQRSWHATCDAMLAKLALCEEFEHGAQSCAARAALEERWAVQPSLPAAWEQALTRRASQPRPEPISARSTGSTDDLLLQLEAAFQIDSPPALAAARRELKLRAMKAALEGRQRSAAAPLTFDALLAAALERTGLDEPQRERLTKILAALRERGPTSEG